MIISIFHIASHIVSLMNQMFGDLYKIVAE